MTFEEAVARHRAGDVGGAEALYRQTLAEGPHVGALQNLATILRGRGELDAAQGLLAQALVLDPARGPLHYNLGNVLFALGRLDAAGEAFEAAMARMPEHDDTALNLGLVRLAQRRWAEGWTLYDRRPERRMSAAQKLRFPEWQGEPLAGKRLLVWGEQGLGDQILMARFFRRLGAQVTLAVRDPLARLFRSLSDEVILKQGMVEVAPHDFWIQPLSIPRWLGVTPETLGEPYLSGQARGAGGVGVVWRGNALPDPGRSIPNDLGRRLLDLPGAVSLLPEDTGAADMQDTADIIAGLDLVVTIDTSVAHLAGAMGKPCWVLLQAAGSDWRWLEGEPGRSLWYPTSELLRQPRPGDWEGVLAEVARRLV